MPLFLLALALTTGTSPSAVSASSPDLNAITALLEQYNRGTETRNVDLFDGILHPEARQFVAGPQFMMIDTPTFLQLLGDGTIGGVEREVVTHGVEIDGLLATAHVTFEGEAAVFDNYVSLLKLDGAWQIVSIAIEMTPRAQGDG